jgi:hypothetical protein
VPVTDRREKTWLFVRLQRIEISKAMIEITTSNSISVKPARTACCRQLRPSVGVIKQ